MNDDRFNFDDEMPDWLQDDQPENTDPVAPSEWDIPDDVSANPPSPTAPQSLGVTGELPWRQDASDPTAPSGNRSGIDGINWDDLDADDDNADMFADASDDSESLDWLTDDSFESSVTPEASAPSSDDVPDWLSEPADFDTDTDSSDTGFDTAFESSADDSSDWLSDSSDFETADVTTATSEPSTETFDLDDFDAMFDEASQPQSEASVDDDDDVDLLDLLFDDDFPDSDNSSPDESVPSGTIRRLSDAAPPAEEQSQLRRLSDAPAPSQPAAPQAPEEPRRIRKLSEAGKPVSDGELTFDEWERQQSQQQFEEENAEELAIEAEVPDWFQDNVKMGDAADEIASLLIPEEDLPDVAPTEEGTGGLGGNYVPEWFLGLEEQNLDEAPDWVRDAAGSTEDVLTNLVDTSAFAPPEPEPEPPAPTTPQFTPEGDVPDWFAGVDAGLGLGATTGDDEDWMSSFATPPAPEQPTVSTDFDLPDLTSAVPQAVEDDESDWMADMSAVEAAPMSIEDADDDDLSSLFDDDFGDEPDLMPLQTSNEDEPDWMSDLGLPSTDASPPPQIPVASTSDVDVDSPSWLQDYETPAASDDSPDLFADQNLDSDMEWLQDVDSVDFSDAFAADTDKDPFDQLQATSAPTTQDIIASADVSNLDDLFGMTDPASSLVPSGMGATDDDLFSSTDDIDDLFDGVDESLFETFADSSTTSSIPASDTLAEDDDVVAYEGEGPGWVDKLRPDMQVKLNIGGLNVDFDQQGVNQLPESLQSLRDQTRDVVQNIPKEIDEAPATQGPLAGISGGLSISPVAAAAPSELELTTQTTIPGHQAKQIDILEEALAIAQEAEIFHDEPDFVDLESAAPAPTPKQARKKQRAKRKFDRFIISFILFVAIVAPFATEALHIAEEPNTTALAAEQQLVISAVTDLEPGDYVLLAFEYGPTAAGELNALSEAVLRDILSQRAIPIIISTNPLGALNGRSVLEKLAADEDLLNALERDENLVAGEDYFALRYISGGAVAIRNLSHSESLSAFVFSNDNTGEETNLDFGRVDAEDFALTFVIGESIDDVRNWAEQFDVPDLPKFVLLTAATEPLVRAYVNPNGTSAFWGYLAGYRDTYRYNELRNQRTLSAFEAPDDIDIPDPDISQWHSMAVGALVAGLLVIIGMVFNTLRNTRRRRRA